jgi:N12 class adenine-specific DNA methylase
MDDAALDKQIKFWLKDATPVVSTEQAAPSPAPAPQAEVRRPRQPRPAKVGPQTGGAANPLLVERERTGLLAEALTPNPSEPAVNGRVYVEQRIAEGFTVLSVSRDGERIAENPLTGATIVLADPALSAHYKAVLDHAEAEAPKLGGGRVASEKAAESAPASASDEIAAPAPAAAPAVTTTKPRVVAPEVTEPPFAEVYDVATAKFMVYPEVAATAADHLDTQLRLHGNGEVRGMEYEFRRKLADWLKAYHGVTESTIRQFIPDSKGQYLPSLLSDQQRADFLAVQHRAFAYFTGSDPIPAFVDYATRLRNEPTSSNILNQGVLLALVERPAGCPFADRAWGLLCDALGSDYRRKYPVRPAPGAPLRAFFRAYLGERGWSLLLRDRAARIEMRTALREEALAPDSSPKTPEERDFSYGRSEIVTPRGDVTRVKANIEAIRLVKSIEAEGGRLATLAERDVLKRYNGWGGTKWVFEKPNYTVQYFIERFSEKNDFAAMLKAAEAQFAEAKARAVARGYSLEYATRDAQSILTWLKDVGVHQMELKRLLTPAEYAAAEQSTLNAHYTEEGVCHRLWDIARRAGFIGGRVLEPACGAGRILGAMPSDLRAKSEVDAVELDPMSARITALLFPQTKVHACGFEEAVIPAGSMDLVITNVPFHKDGPGVQVGYPCHFNLHNYFIAESLRKLKPGGIAVIITSASTLENNPEQREALNSLGEFHGGIRLPADAFDGNANTEVVTDILVWRKGDQVRMSSQQDMVGRTVVELPEGQRVPAPRKKDQTAEEAGEITLTNVNGYFARNPDMVLGLHSLQGSLYGRQEGGQYTVVTPEGAPPLAERLDAAIERLPQAIATSKRALGEAKLEVIDYASVRSTASERTGSLVRRSGKDGEPDRFYIVQPDGELLEAPWMLGDLPKGLPTKAAAAAYATAYLRLYDRLIEQIRIDLDAVTTDETSAAARKELSAAYEDFVGRYGTLHANTERIRSLAPQDSMMSSVFALEDVKELPRQAGKQRKYEVKATTILNERTLFPAARPVSPTTVEDGVYASLNHSGTIDLTFIANALNRDGEEKIIAEEIISAGLAFRDFEAPDRLIARRDFLSGDILDKLVKCQAALVSDPRMELGYAALQAVKPAPVSWSKIESGLAFGALWLPAEFYARFLRDQYGCAVSIDSQPVYSQALRSWVWPELGRSHTSAFETRLGVDSSHISAPEIVAAALSQRSPQVTYREEGKTFTDQTATEAVRVRIAEMNKNFAAWVNANADAKEVISQVYNQKFNRTVMPSDFGGEKLTFPGIAQGPNALDPRTYQRQAAARMIARPAGVIAHGTGFGKTLTGILIAQEHRRMGLSQKPLMVCDTANYKQFVAAYRAIFPRARILVADDANFCPEERENFKAQVAYGNFDCVLMSRTQFGAIPVSDALEEATLQDELDELEAALDAAMENADGDRMNGAVRKAQSALYTRQQKLAKAAHERGKKKDKGLVWEQLGVDLLIVDECHRHKKTGFATAFGDVKGVDAMESTRGRDLLMKGGVIQKRRKGLGVIGLSGTPVTNTIAEFWTMNRLFDPNRLEEFSVPTFDHFYTSFCESQTRLEMNEANGQYRYVERVCAFRMVPVLRNFIMSGCDVQLDSSKLNLTLPEHVNGSIEICTVPLTDSTLGVMEDLSDLYSEFEQATGKEKRDLSWVPITLMQFGMAASIDPRLFDKNAPDDPNSLCSKVVENVAAIHKETAKDRLTQCIFLDRYRSADLGILRRGLGYSRGDVEAVATEEGNGPIVVNDQAEIPGSAEDVDDPTQAASFYAEEADNGRFNLYRDIVEKLVRAGVPREEIAVIGDAKNPEERMAMFEKMNRGTLRVLIGSSDKMGIGANFQERLYAAHNFDPPRNMTPDQQEQRDGRILRSGNKNKKVRVIYYGMEDTVTPAIINRIQIKRQFVRAGFFGEGDRMEDVGDIRLDQFQAALVPDKRMLKMADLRGQEKEVALGLDVAERRAVSLRQSHEWTLRQMKTLQENNLPHARQSMEFAAAQTQPITGSALLRVDLTNMAAQVATLVDASAESKEWFAKRQEAGEPLVLEGKYEAVEKVLGKLFDTLKTTKLPWSKEAMSYGTINVNGFHVQVEYAKYKLASSDRNAEGLLMSVQDRAHSAKGLGYYSGLRHVRFGSPMSFLGTLAAIPASLSSEVRALEMQIEARASEIEAQRLEMGKLTEPVELLAQHADLKKQIGDLERDLVANPYVRGKNRRGKPELAMVVPAAEETIVPAAEETKVKASSPAAVATR